MADPSYNRFFNDPDQASRRAELTAFFGPHADKFLKAYDEQRALVVREPGQKPAFNFFRRSYVWPAFFIGPVWFFYRRMWTWGIGITVVIIGVGLTPLGNRIGLPAGVAMAGTGAFAYIHHAVKRIEQLRATAAGGVLSPEQLARAGGVSTLAGWIGGTVYLLLTLLAIYGIMVEARTGVPLPR